MLYFLWLAARDIWINLDLRIECKNCVGLVHVMLANIKKMWVINTRINNGAVTDASRTMHYPLYVFFNDVHGGYIILWLWDHPVLPVGVQSFRLPSAFVQHWLDEAMPVDSTNVCI